MNKPFRLSIIDGTIHIVASSADQDIPRYVENHYPTTIRARDAAYYFGCEVDELSELEVTEYFSGHYRIRNTVNKYGPTHSDITLVSGGKTMPVSTTFVDYHKPKTRLETNYEDGYWWKNTAKGWVRM